MKMYQTTPRRKETIDSLWRLMKIILDSLDFNEVVQRIVDSVLTELGYLKLGYSIVVLALIDKKEGILRRISISQTQKAKEALAVTPVPFEKIDIPLSSETNLCIKVLKSMNPATTHDWRDILTPPFTEEDARKVQNLVGIKTSMVYPVVYQGKTQGILIFSMVKDESGVSENERDLIRGYSDIVGLAVQNSSLYSELGATSHKLQKANVRLKEIDRQKDEFISVAAHELRSPMTAIKGYVSMILEGDTGEVSAKARGYLADTQSITERLIRLVNNMLNVSRIEEGRMVYQLESVELTEVAKEIYYSFRVEAERKKLEFTLEIPDAIKDEVYVDPDRIREVVGNLVSNAIKFTEAGSVKVKLSQSAGDKVKLEVIDTGPGISKPEQKKLFQKFYRAESTEGKTMGTGLGLYICRLLMEKFSGKIGLDSEAGRGANFWIDLPLYAK